MPDVAGRLLDRWADVNKGNAAGRTALDLSIYWAIKNPINGSSATAILRRIIQSGGLSGQEVEELAAASAGNDGQPQDPVDAENERIWMAQCNIAANMG